MSEQPRLDAVSPPIPANAWGMPTAEHDTAWGYGQNLQENVPPAAVTETLFDMPAHSEGMAAIGRAPEELTHQQKLERIAATRQVFGPTEVVENKRGIDQLHDTETGGFASPFDVNVTVTKNKLGILSARNEAGKFISKEEFQGIYARLNSTLEKTQTNIDSLAEPLGAIEALPTVEIARKVGNMYDAAANKLFDLATKLRNKGAQANERAWVLSEVPVESASTAAAVPTEKAFDIRSETPEVPVEQGAKVGIWSGIKDKLKQAMSSETVQKVFGKESLIGATANRYKEAFQSIREHGIPRRKDYLSEEGFRDARMASIFAVVGAGALALTTVQLMRGLGAAEHSAEAMGDGLAADASDISDSIGRGHEDYDGNHNLDPFAYSTEADPYYDQDKLTPNSYGEGLLEAQGIDPNDPNISDEAKAEAMFTELQERWKDSPEQLAAAMADYGFEGMTLDRDPINTLADQMKADPDLWQQKYDAFVSELKTADIAFGHTDGPHATLYEYGADGADPTIHYQAESYIDSYTISFTQHDEQGNITHQAELKEACGGQSVLEIDYPTTIPPLPPDQPELEPKDPSKDINNAEGIEDGQLDTDDQLVGSGDLDGEQDISRPEETYELPENQQPENTPTVNESTGEPLAEGADQVDRAPESIPAPEAQPGQQAAPTVVQPQPYFPNPQQLEDEEVKE